MLCPPRPWAATSLSRPPGGDAFGRAGPGLDGNPLDANARKEGCTPLPFSTSAPAMVFGHDTVENARRLTEWVDNVEVVYFHTPTLNNYLSSADARKLRRIGERQCITYSVHLPASMQIAAPDDALRRFSVRMGVDLILRSTTFSPRHYILHIPYSPPTLAPVPGHYFTANHGPEWDGWLKRATESLQQIHAAIPPETVLLAENTNFSLGFLAPLVQKGFCSLCIDVGHLILGRESVMAALRTHLSDAPEIHLHGVSGFTDHLALDRLPVDRLAIWMFHLASVGYRGVVNLEVFSSGALQRSLALVRRLTPRIATLCDP